MEELEGAPFCLLTIYVGDINVTLIHLVVERIFDLEPQD